MEEDANVVSHVWFPTFKRKVVAILDRVIKPLLAWTI